MKALISTIGSRGDVQPILALALELRALGHDARLCVAPNFKDWVESFGLECLPIGPDLKQLTGATAPGPSQKPSAGQLRQLAAYTVRAQFPVLAEAARGCDLVLGAGALQIATRSVAEALQIPYVFAAFCPAVLPSPGHPPPKMGTHYSQSLSASDNASLWLEEARSWNGLFRETLNEERVKAHLAPVEDVQRHIFTHYPWLAADPAIAPAGATTDMQIVHSGAWLLPNPSALPDDVEQFLASGDPPIYFGFGSMRAPEQTSRILIEAARTLGLRSIISRGWGDLAPIDDGGDCLSVGEVAHEALFPRVAAVVHHGGAGTTTAAARAGKAQVIVPHLYDQYYWAYRVQQLGVGVSSFTRDELAVDSVVCALRECLDPAMTARGQVLASRIELRGAAIAAQRLVEEFG
jgi:vancomycin aglycone glucosyltransferase